MRPGDRALYYHSGGEKAVVGLSRVVRAAYPDPTAAAGEPWVAVDLAAAGPLAAPVSLAAAKADPALSQMVLVRNSRLSVQPVTEAEWARVLALGGAPG
jgi:predicted RNA-binding protein with PUA-like domain